MPPSTSSASAPAKAAAPGRLRSERREQAALGRRTQRIRRPWSRRLQVLVLLALLFPVIYIPGWPYWQEAYVNGYVAEHGKHFVLSDPEAVHVDQRVRVPPPASERGFTPGSPAWWEEEWFRARRQEHNLRWASAGSPTWSWRFDDNFRWLVFPAALLLVVLGSVQARRRLHWRRRLRSRQEMDDAFA